ncbi:MAG: hypothetical protein WC530_07960 [Candidatus Omnitrophota bacterium]
MKAFDYNEVPIVGPGARIHEIPVPRDYKGYFKDDLEVPLTSSWAKSNHLMERDFVRLVFTHDSNRTSDDKWYRIITVEWLGDLCRIHAVKLPPETVIL